MPTISKCEECGRQGGYATHEDDETCARCTASGKVENGNTQDQE